VLAAYTANAIDLFNNLDSLSRSSAPNSNAVRDSRDGQTQCAAHLGLAHLAIARTLLKNLTRLNQQPVESEHLTDLSDKRASGRAHSLSAPPSLASILTENSTTQMSICFMDVSAIIDRRFGNLVLFLLALQYSSHNHLTVIRSVYPPSF
jgi:hypothetical protein